MEGTALMAAQFLTLRDGRRSVRHLSPEPNSDEVLDVPDPQRKPLKEVLLRY
jgi:hypothetical protein